ncbi:hypothetical protein ACFFU1_16750 [Algibacter miyuki]|uniref:Uncharacterized protein n=1 Tax=Algibacter miyuki TaxID=1306933 RepID=A0ABV5H3S4_9FLAO|nr:hypothetical protein [Algibacter miyuki]MDN3665629.1 hypothetical protein [Algibacter miyuki]
MNIERYGKEAIVHNESMCYTYKAAENPRDFSEHRVNKETLDWVNKDYHVGDWRIHPYGDNNNLPKEIQRVIQNNSDAPGELKRKTNLLWGKGPKLYKEEIVDNELVRTWTEDPDIQAWLDKWDHEEYLMKCSVDYQHLEGFFTKFFLNKGYTRTGRTAKIAKLEHSQLDRTRKVSRRENRTSKATHALITDFSFESMSDLLDLSVYPLFDFKTPFKHHPAVHYSNMYSFCQDYYTVPDIYGALEWIRRSNASPIILKALSKNGINPSYHIESPQAFWDLKEKQLKQNCTDRGVQFKYQMLIDYENELLKSVSKVLSSEENTGKFWHTKKGFEVDGTNLIEHGWTIKKIEQNVLDYIKAQEIISNHSSKKISSSIGLHSAISGGGTDTKVNSGGEQHYALQNYLLTQNDIPEMIVMKCINMALKINFPNKNLKMGFYHISPKKLQDVTPSERPEAKL